MARDRDSKALRSSNELGVWETAVGEQLCVREDPFTAMIAVAAC